MENERYPYWPIVEREPIRWPNGARVAFWVIPNIEHFRFDQPGYEAGRNARFPDVYGYAARDYGNRVGVWRLMDAFDRFGIRATVALNSDVCVFHPQIVKAGVERGWSWWTSIRISRLGSSRASRMRRRSPSNGKPVWFW